MPDIQKEVDGMLSEERFYTVLRIDGDYAVLLPDGGAAI